MSKPKNAQLPETIAFEVWDSQENQFADLDEIMGEKWARDLPDLDGGWGILQDGTLILCSEDGQFAFAPEHRFEIQFVEP